MPASHKDIEPHSKIGGLLKESVFGFNDGVVSTFAVIAGLTGGAIENKTVLLAALATLIAGAFSMGLGTYLGSKSEKDHYENERKREIDEMENLPEREVQEIRDIYIAKGFSGKLLEEVVAKITSNKKVWLETMMAEELGFAQEPPKPALNGITMSLAFVVGSSIPTIPYFFSNTTFQAISLSNFAGIFVLSLGLSVAGLLLAGGLKTYFTGRKIIFSSLETLAVGALAAAGAYVIGILIA